MRASACCGRWTGTSFGSLIPRAKIRSGESGSSRGTDENRVHLSRSFDIASLCKAGFADDHIAALIEPSYHSIRLRKVPAYIGSSYCLTNAVLHGNAPLFFAFWINVQGVC